jgi:uncharacterized protein
MLKLKPSCEQCDVGLPPDSTDARICTFECTFCSECVETILRNVCPNCGGGFERRPIRPKDKLAVRPATMERTHKPMDPQSHAKLLGRFEHTPPNKR